MPPKPDDIIEKKLVEETVIPDSIIETALPDAPEVIAAIAAPAERGPGDHRGGRGGGQGGRGRGRGPGGNRGPRGGRDEQKSDLLEKVVFINRCANVFF